MKLIRLLAPLAVLSMALTAHATAITYTIGNSSQLSGTVGIVTFGTDINVAGIAAASTFDYSDAYHHYHFTEPGNFYSSSDNYLGGFSLSGPDYSAGSGGFVLYIPFDPFRLPTDTIHLCSVAHPCTSNGSPLYSNLEVFHAGGGFDTFNLTSGDLVPNLAATPEPSSVLLLGTGLLSVVGAARRRYLKP